MAKANISQMIVFAVLLGFVFGVLRDAISSYGPLISGLFLLLELVFAFTIGYTLSKSISKPIGIFLFGGLFGLSSAVVFGSIGTFSIQLLPAASKASTVMPFGLQHVLFFLSILVTNFVLFGLCAYGGYLCFKLLSPTPFRK